MKSLLLCVSRAAAAAFVLIALSAVPARAQTTALYLESQSGDYVGGGQTRTYTAAEATFAVSATSGAIGATVAGPDLALWWNLNFLAPRGASVAPGTYTGANRFATATSPGLDVYGNGRGCNTLTGRFFVRELEFDIDGTVLRFAADFEQHCEDGAPGLFGAIRVNSTVSTLAPFDGAYPDYRLTIVPAIGGLVTGNGFACSATQALCTQTYTRATFVSLQAAPAPGFVLAGWAGACATEGASSFAFILVNGPRRCEALFDPLAGPLPTTALYVESQAGDVAGGGVTRTYMAPDATFSLFGDAGRVNLNMFKEFPDFASWSLSFSAPQGMALQPGTYIDAVSGQAGSRPGLAIAGSGGCAPSTGRFLVREFVRAANGTVLRFAADFEQHCNDGAPALFGAIRYKSTVSALVPFDGAYPDYRLTITRPAHGSVTGGGIACSTTETTCVRTLTTPAAITLTATPDLGFTFLGWAGSCFGTATVTVQVNQPKHCEAFFDSTTSPAARTGLFIDSQIGDTVGQGRQWLYNASNSAWTISQIDSFNGRGVHIDISGQTSWSLDFDADSRLTLAPGTYLGAVWYPFNGVRAGLRISGAVGCSQVSGWFVIRELETAADGSIVRFAADFEQHCNNADPALFGAVRYNSTVATLAPFDGVYPTYRLTIAQPAHGSVTGVGGGFACTSAPSDPAECAFNLPVPANVTLTATADPGYLFVGWSGSCAGLATTTLHVNQTMRCEALFDSTTAPAARTVLFLDSQSGDTVGQGVQRLYGADDAAWTIGPIEFGTRRGVHVELSLPDFSFWSLDFYAGRNETMTPRAYPGARRYAFSSLRSGLNVVRSNGSCSELTARFVVREIVFATDGSVTRFAADFEQHCNGADPALFGAVRYNSTVSTFVPFDGAYPNYRLTITPSAHGSVTGAGIACSATQTGCVGVLPTPANVTLTAIPDAGFTFIGWRGGCLGTATVTVRVNQPIQCEALFDSTTAPAARTGLFLDSQAGDFIGQGRQWFYGAENGTWSISPISSSERRGVSVRISDLVSWTLDFDAGQGSPLAPGTYSGVTRQSFSSPSPGMHVSGGFRGCSQVAGLFVVRELEIATDGSIVRFAADFEQRCNNADAALFGALRYNSTVPSLTPFGGNYPDYRLTIVPGAHGVVTGDAISCGPGQSNCVQVMSAPATITLLAVPERGYALRGWSGDCAGGRHTFSVRVNSRKQCAPLFLPLVAPHDLDGDGKGDLAVWRPGDGTWYWATSSSGFNDAAARGKQWGSQAEGDVPLLGDVDGDAVEDLIVWRASTGTWFWLTSSSGYNYAAAGSKQWGSKALDDVPMVGDMDGDGRTDLVIWRRSNGTFYWLTSTSGYSYVSARGIQWGSASLGDQPLLGDFDGDGLQDPAVWRASNGTWYWLSSAAGYSYAAARGLQWGSQSQGDVAFTGDIDGDSRSELIVWRPAAGTWFWLTSASGYSYAAQRHVAWGSAPLGDVPAVGDFDGDRNADLAVWRASTGTWHWLTSSSGYDPSRQGVKQWGSQARGDIPMVR